MKTISILGSTGSIGTQTLEIIRDNPAEYKVRALTCRENEKLLAEQIREFKPEFASIATEDAAARLSEAFPETRVFSGREGLYRIAEDQGSDMLVNALVGMAGLVPTYRAVEAKRTIALANKETLVAGGALIMKAAADRGAEILPVDSEHSAVFQSLQGFERSQVRRIILTASGGPFRTTGKEELKNVKAEQALKNPNWNMGAKVTVDSSTLMNKGFEITEARWLFDMPEEKIDVVVHPESIIHSMVEYEDGAVMAELGVPDMKIPISYALGYPRRVPNTMESLDLVKTGRLTFEAPDTDRFRCLGLARSALRAGGTYSTALNAANEVMVKAFLQGSAGFTDIPEVISKVLDAHKSRDEYDLDEILQADKESRDYAEKLVSEL
ncbi:MAG: 1-deoxy-D-xylulose-5-phosphate reductoisomerase [Anaerovoracaceae bacterium]|jgi:1-deoxy-D-xylulose-5-phosphate reductoisomerase